MKTAALPTSLPNPTRALVAAWRGPLHAAFERRATETPQQLAVVDAEVRWSYGELAERSAQLAHELTANGVGPQEVIAVYGNRCASLVWALLGILRAGAAYLILDPAHPPNYLIRCLKRAQPKGLLEIHGAGPLPDELHAALGDLALNVRLQIPSLAKARQCGLFRNQPTTLADQIWTADHRATITLTSGTTGEPKAVIAPHGPLEHYLWWVRQAFDFTPEDRFSLLSGLSHDPLLRDIFTPLSVGATLDIPDSSELASADRLLAWLDRRQITVAHLTPARLRLLQTFDSHPRQLALRWVFIGGEPLVGADVSALEALAPRVQCVNVYGTTETPQVMSAFKVPPASNTPRDPCARIPIGRGIDGVQLLVLDHPQQGKSCQLADIGQVGEICVRTPYLAAGYLNEASFQGRQFQTNPFTDNHDDRMYRTGDLGRYTDSRDVEILGRIDRQINLRGARVEPDEIEHHLAQHSAVRQATVAHVPTVDKRPMSEPFLMAFYTVSGPPPSDAELRRFLAHRLPATSVPSRFWPLDDLPLSPNGKIDTAALQRLAVDIKTPTVRSEQVTPNSPIEDRLSRIWCEVLGRNSIGPTDDFFALGGHSLSATHITSRIRQHFGIELPPRTLFDHPTLAQLADQLDVNASAATEAKNPKPTLARVASTAGSQPPLSFAQQRLWFLDQLEPGNPAYSLPTVFTLAGNLEIPALQQALDAVVARHEVLRTTFPSLGGEPFQDIVATMTVLLPRIDLRFLKGEATRIAKDLAAEDALRPFDLAQGPLVRGCLVQTDDRHHWLLFNLHHIVTDGWSQAVLYRDLAVFYHSFTKGDPQTRRTDSSQPQQLPQLPVQYADFAIWQRAWLRDRELDRRLTYWRQQLADAPETIQLTTDRSRPNVQTYRGATLPLTLSPGLTQGLSTLGGPTALGSRDQTPTAHQGVSPFMILVTAFMAWLGRVAGQDDLVIGTPIANRDQAEIENLVGFFVNMLALRANVSQNPCFVDLLGQVRATALDAYDFQDLPFEALVDELAPERDLGQHPLFQVTFALHNTLRANLQLPRLDVQPVTPPVQAVRFDLEIHLWDVADGREAGALQGEAIYNADLFDATTIQRSLDQFNIMLDATLEAILVRREARIHDLSLLSPSQRHQLLMEWNDTAATHPTGFCLHHLISTSADHNPDAIAVAEADRQMTYGQLMRSAHHHAQHLRNLGVEAESRVGICLERGLDLVVSLIATLEAGGAYVPLDPDYPEERLTAMLEDARVGVLITRKPALGQANGHSIVTMTPSCVTPGVATPEAVSSHTQGLSIQAPAEFSDAQVAYVLFTSGSTGRPKGVTVSHRNIVHHMRWMQHAFPLDATDRVLQKTPFSFDASVWEFWAPLLAGGRLALARPGGHRDPGELVGTIQNYRVSVLQVVPSLLVLLLEQPGFRQCRTLRRIYCGGEALTEELVQRFLEQGPSAELVNVYGPSEGTIHATSKRVTDTGCRVSLGRPIDNAQVHLLDTSHGGSGVPLGAIGHLHLAGAGLARGYFDRPRWTAASFLPDPFATHAGNRLYATGDLARYTPSGELEFLGRIDHQIKLRGVRLELGEIEAVLGQHPAVREAAAMPPRDAKGQLVAFVAATPPTLSAEDIAAWHRERVTQWQMLHNDTYQSGASRTNSARSGLPRQQEPADPTLDFSGWNSSYTGLPIPVAEMRQWLDTTVERIRRLKPKRVLEIGCGSGLLLYQLAPNCRRYLATDFSRVALRTLRQHVDRRPDLARVELLERAADDFSGMDRDRNGSVFDTVLLNSVVQYFPSADYLLTVLRSAVDITTSGGRIFIGDVRSLPLLDAYCESVELFKAAPGTSQDDLQERVRQRREREEELVLDPAFFTALRLELPRIHRARILTKTGQASIELTRFRYDVVLELDNASLEPGGEGDPSLEGQETSEPPRPWRVFANDPAYQHRLQRLIESLKDHLHRQLPQAMHPATIVVLDQLPHQPNGKIDRRALHRRGSSRVLTAQPDRIAPRSAIERRLADTWSEVLGVATFGVHDNFFDLGGHSLLAVQVIARLRHDPRQPDREGVGLSLQDLFENPTLARLAVVVEQRIEMGFESRLEQGTDVSPAIARLPRDRELPLSFPQQRLWFLHQLQPTSAAYHMPELYHLTGYLDAPLLAGCWNTILRRHEILRTTFPEFEGQPRQKIAPFVERPLPILDLRGLGGSSQRRETLHQAQREAARPFHLETGPLVRMLLLRWSDDEHALFLNLHHIVSDGWSQKVLYRELRALYLIGKPQLRQNPREPSPRQAPVPVPELPELPVQYADYAMWQHHRVSNQRLAKLIVAWRELLGNDIPALALPTDRPRPAGQPPHRGAAHYFTWPVGLVEMLRSRGKEANASLYMILLAGLVAWLHFASGRRRIRVGSPVANRDHTEIEGLIGCFVNTLVLPGTISHDEPFDDHLSRILRNTLRAFAAQELPFEKLVEALQPERDTSRNPLFQIGLTLLDDRQQGPSLPGVTSRPLAFDFQAARLDLECLLWPAPQGSGLCGKLIYRPDLFDTCTVGRWALQLETLLISVARDPNRRLSELPRCPDAERHQLLVEWNATETTIESQESLHRLISTRAKHNPDRVAVLFGNHHVSYRDLERRSDGLAKQLWSRALPPDAPIAICMERSAEVLCGLLGILKAGLAYLPLDPEDPPARRDQLLTVSRAKMLIVGPELEGPLDTQSVDAHAVDLQRIEVLLVDAVSPEAAVDGPADQSLRPYPASSYADAPAYMIYTSGSTGRPKLTVNTHRAIVNRLCWMQTEFRLGASDRVLQKTPLVFDVSVWELFWPLMSGATLVMAAPGGHRDPQYLQGTIDQYRITTLHFVPSMLDAFLSDLDQHILPTHNHHLLPTLQRVISSGEALSNPLKERFLALLGMTSFGAQLHNLYGPTEAAIDVSHARCLTRETVTIGRPIANTRLYITDRWLMPLPRHAPGELVIAGRQVAQGYRGAPSLTAERFVPDPFCERPGRRLYRTGDLTSWSNHGHINYLGRRDHQVKIRGVRIELGEVEATLEALPTVDRAVARVIERVTTDGQEKVQDLIAYLVPKAIPTRAVQVSKNSTDKTLAGKNSVPNPFADELTLSNLRQQLHHRLAPVMIPNQLILLKSLPLTSNGKVDRRKLPLPGPNTAVSKGGSTAPRTAIEFTVADIWRRVLGVEHVGVHDNFFELGGHSLLATQITSRIRQELHRELPIRKLFETPTVAAISRWLEHPQGEETQIDEDALGEFEEGLL